MALTPKLDLRQGQQLVMTPQLQQAIRLLQYSNLELAAFVETELERNPLLEREEAEPSDAVEAQATPSDAGEPELDLARPAAETASSTFDTDHENVFPDDTRTEMQRDGATSGWESVRQRTSNDPDGDFDLEGMATSALSLKDHLTAQANIAFADAPSRLIASHIVDLVDEAGYVQGDLAALAEKLGAPDGMVERVLAVMQTFEPVGVCARTLAECMALQLRELNRFDPLMQRLVDNLPLLAARNLAALKRAVGVDQDELLDMVQELRRLDPKPGLKYGSVEVQPVLPDVFVRPANDGSWRVELNSETLPRVLVNRSYYALVSRSKCSEKDKGYLTECLQSANWLVKSLDQRARTILKVAEEIVRQQDGFLTYGIQHMRPLNLKTVADRIGMHESTVSRVTSNKYMATPRGIYELKYFFNSAISSAEEDAESHSSEAVRHRIRQLISAETAATVLSDDKIVEKLKADGIDIARRTVAKYREAMRISSSVQRRREKAMEAGLSKAG